MTQKRFGKLDAVRTHIDTEEFAPSYGDADAAWDCPVISSLAELPEILRKERKTILN